MTSLEPELQGADRVREYFTRMRNGDIRVADLYADDGTLVPPGSAPIEGRDAIREYYAQIFEHVRPEPTVVAFLEAPPLYVGVVEVGTTSGSNRVVDLFEVGDGGIRKLEIFIQSLPGSGAQ